MGPSKIPPDQTRECRCCAEPLAPGCSTCSFCGFAVVPHKTALMRVVEAVSLAAGIGVLVLFCLAIRYVTGL